MKDDRIDEEDTMRRLNNGEGYNDIMEDVNGIRKLTLSIFYDWYGNKTGKSKHDVTQHLVDIGISQYNKLIGEDCKTVNDVQKSFSENLSMSFTDTLGMLVDRGMMDVIEEEFGVGNAYSFLKEMGVDIPDDD